MHSPGGVLVTLLPDPEPAVVGQLAAPAAVDGLQQHLAVLVVLVVLVPYHAAPGTNRDTPGPERLAGRGDRVSSDVENVLARIERRPGPQQALQIRREGYSTLWGSARPNNIYIYISPA